MAQQSDAQKSQGHPLYNISLGLLTDQYQLTMAYGYWRSGKAEDDAVFDYFFRRNPFDGGYTVFAGLETLVDYLDHWHFTQEDVEYLAGLRDSEDKPIFNDWFLEYLGKLKFTCSVDAMPEGTVVFPNEPIIRVRGPLLQCQILETPLLAICNFQSLIATKSSRICREAGDDPVLEFGLRRAHGIDGGISASRAAFIGGCDSTSNVLAGRLFGIPVKGTHSHSWVMSFDDEMDSFQTFANVLPGNVVLLVDTYDSLAAIEKAIRIGKDLKKNGHKLLGIRLDSGDLSRLSRRARQMLDNAGLQETHIFATNDLDEHAIAELKRRDAKITVWGIGTRLVTAYDDPALGGVYKLAGIGPGPVEKHGAEVFADWRWPIKLSDDEQKMTTPGYHQVRRFFSEGSPVGDMIMHLPDAPDAPREMVIPAKRNMTMRFGREMTSQDLLKPVYAGGEKTFQPVPLRKIRETCRKNLAVFEDVYTTLDGADAYPVGLENRQFELKNQAIRQARKRRAE